MKNLPIPLLVSASILGLSAFAHADDAVVKLPEPLAGSAELFKNAPTIVSDTAEKTGEMASDAVKAGEEATEKAAEMPKDAVKATENAVEATAEKADETASDAVKAGEEATEKAAEMAKDAVKATDDAVEATAEKAGETASDAMKATDEIKVPEPMAGSSDLVKTAPMIAAEKPAMVEDKPAEAMAATDYTIVKGDTLWDIAKAKLGDATRYQAIIDANPGIVPRDLKVGNGLKLPAQ